MAVFLCNLQDRTYSHVCSSIIKGPLAHFLSPSKKKKKSTPKKIPYISRNGSL